MKFDLTTIFYHLESRAIEISLTLIVFLGTAYYGVTDILKEMLSGLNIPGLAIAFGLLVFCYTGVITGKLILECVTNSAKAFFSTFFNVLARALCFTVKYLEEKHRTKIKLTSAIKRLNEHELAFLELFHPNGIALKRMTCPTDGGRRASLIHWAAIETKGVRYGRKGCTTETVYRGV